MVLRSKILAISSLLASYHGVQSWVPHPLTTWKGGRSFPTPATTSSLTFTRNPRLCSSTSENGAVGETSQLDCLLSKNNSTHTVASFQEQFGLFFAMSKPYFVENDEAKWLLGGVIALTLLNSGVSVAFSYLSRDFWSALNAKDAEHFQEVLLKFLGALAAGVPVVVLSSFQRELLSLKWREWMTERMLALYFGGSEATMAECGAVINTSAAVDAPQLSTTPYFAIESGGSLSSAAGKVLDNPDQRIAEDVRAFTRSSLSFALTLLRSAVDLASFSLILYSIYPLLFAVILVYSSVGTAVTVSLGSKLVELNYAGLRKEADFRFGLVRVRENAESIAFYGGEALERAVVDKRLESLMTTRRDLINVERNLDFFTTAYQFLIQILPGAVVAPLFFAGKVELGVVSQSFGAFNHILNDFSIIVNQFEALSQFSAGVDRLGEFALRLRDEAGADEVMKLPPGTAASVDFEFRERAKKAVAAADASAVDKKATRNGVSSATGELLELAGTAVSAGFASLPSSSVSALDAEEGMMESSSTIRMSVVPGCGGVAVRGLDLYTPDRGRLLIRGLNLDLAAPTTGCTSSRLLIVGPSGSGKSSLLRAIAGLWTAGCGAVERPPSSEMMFLPQRPYW